MYLDTTISPAHDVEAKRLIGALVQRDVQIHLWCHFKQGSSITGGYMHAYTCGSDSHVIANQGLLC